MEEIVTVQMTHIGSNEMSLVEAMCPVCLGIYQLCTSCRQGGHRQSPSLREFRL